MNSADINLYASSGAPNDSGDVVFRSNDGTERARLWSDTTDINKIRFRIASDSTHDIVFMHTAGCTIGSGTGTTACTSDARMKNIVGTATGNLAKIMQLQPTYYTWKSEASNAVP